MLAARAGDRGFAVAEQKLEYAEVEVGDEAPVLSHELTRTDLVRYAGASGDFNPMHHDDPKAVEAGLPSVFGHGMFSMGLLGRALTDYVGVGNLASYRVRFTKQTWPGELLSTRIIVREKRDGNVAVLACELVNQDGEVKVAGEATAHLP